MVLLLLVEFYLKEIRCLQFLMIVHWPVLSDFCYHQNSPRKHEMR